MQIKIIKSELNKHKLNLYGQSPYGSGNIIVEPAMQSLSHNSYTIKWNCKVDLSEDFLISISYFTLIFELTSQIDAALK